MKNVTNCVRVGIEESVIGKAVIKRPFPVGLFIKELERFTIAADHVLIPVKT